MAQAGVNKKKLIDAYKKNAKNGIKILLSMSINNKVRVTSSEDIISFLNKKI